MTFTGPSPLDVPEIVAPNFNVHELLTDPETKVIVTCGSGGVGKTTTAAALAVYAADAGRKVAVLTIDPAQRLAQSLGLQELDNTPRHIMIDDPHGNGGQLWAMMLDTSRTFDEMVAAHASADRAQQIFDNPFYRTISSSFSGTQEYMAMEKLSQLAATGEYELIVVDTPPSRSALDFLDVPTRLSAFLDGRMIRVLAAPSRGMMRIVGAGFSLFAKAVTAVIGGQMLADAARFVQLFDEMFGGFRQRADATYQLLRDPGSSFVVVATPQADAIREASYFADRLTADQMPLAGLILNRTHSPLVDLSASVTDEALTLAAQSASRAKPAMLAHAALQLHSNRLAVHTNEVRIRARFDRAHPEVPVANVPAAPVDVHDIAGLREVAASLTT